MHHQKKNHPLNQSLKVLTENASIPELSKIVQEERVKTLQNKFNPSVRRNKFHVETVEELVLHFREEAISERKTIVYRVGLRIVGGWQIHFVLKQ